MKLSRVLSAAALTAALLMTGTQSQAAFSTTLGFLEANPGTVEIIGGLTYTFNIVTLTSNGGAPSPADVVVSDSPTGTGFILTGGIFAGPGQDNDVAIVYTVSSPTPITSLTLNGTGFAVGSNDIAVTETVSGTNYSLQLNSSGSETIPIPNLTSLTITKDIFVSGIGVTSGTSSWSIIDQTVAFTVIPEPTSVVLMGTGLVGVLGLGLRRKMTNA
jgi:hypothetical protein